MLVREERVGHSAAVMKNTKNTQPDDREVLAVLNRYGCYGFEAVHIAAYLVKRAGGDVKLAAQLAACPYKLNGQNVW